MQLITVMVFGALSAAAFTGTASAQDIEMGQDSYAFEGDGGDWNIQAGAMGIASNDYPGSDTIQGLVVPYFDVTYKDLYFADPIRGVGMQLLGESRIGSNLTAGIAWNFGRDEDDAAALQGLGDIEGGPALRVAGQLRLGYFNLGGSLKTAISGDTGTEARVSATTRIEPIPGFRLFPSVNAKLGDEERHQAFFGVTDAQAAASVFPAYDVDSGLTSYGVQVLGLYDLTDTLYLTGIVAGDQLTGDVADSPIVEEEFQTFFALGLIKAF